MKMTTPLVMSLALLGGAGLLSSCCSCPDRSAVQAASAATVAPDTLVGTIWVIGNEPFTRLALKTADDTMVVLLCPPAVEANLRSHQGQTARVFYAGEDRVPEGRAVRVTEADLVLK